MKDDSLVVLVLMSTNRSRRSDTSAGGFSTVTATVQEIEDGKEDGKDADGLEGRVR